MIGFGSPDSSTTSPTTGPNQQQQLSDNLAEEQHRDQLIASVESRDLMSYGMIPEFVGRFPMIVSLSSLDRDSLVDILTEPQDALVGQYQKLFEMDRVNLEFSREALLAIADQAAETKTGARGLRAIMVRTVMLVEIFVMFVQLSFGVLLLCRKSTLHFNNAHMLTHTYIQEQLLLNSMYEVPGSNIKTVHVDSDTVQGKTPPHYNYHSNTDDSNNEQKREAGDQKEEGEIPLEHSAVEAEL